MWLAYQGGAIVPVWNSDFHSPHMSIFQMIPQAWSVSLELMFYALAPFLVRRHWLTLLAIIVTTYLLRSLTQTYGFTGSGFVYRFFPIEIGLFLAGVLSHRVYAYVNARTTTRFSVSLAISAALLAIVLVQQFIDSLDNHKFFILVVVALPALFDVSRRIRLDSWLGELSYPIYLAHLAVMSFGEIIATALLGPIENRNWLVLAMAIATVLLSIAYVHWIDSPFERWRQRRTVQAKPERAPEALPQPQPVALSA
jgi:peptidoglycan/LPS O-acetylase OafA/YrhL